MRVLSLTNGYPPLHAGGYEELCQDVAQGLQRRGHRVAVLTTRGHVGGGEDSESGVFRDLEPEVRSGDPWATARLIAGHGRRERHNRRVLARTLDSERPDVAVIWGMWNLTPAIAADLETALGPRVLYYIADYWPTLPDAITQHLNAPARRPAARRLKALLADAMTRPGRRLADGLSFPHVACVSQAVLDTLTTAGIDMRHTEVIHNGIDPLQFAPASTNPKPVGPPIRCLLAGRLTRDKGVFEAIEALSMALDSGHDLRLTLAGGATNDEEHSIRDTIRALGVERRVTLTGRVARHQMPTVMGDHHVLLVPSVWADPLPRVAQEGMAAGLAVIASRIGGLPELIDDGTNGLLVPPGDARALADAIGRLAADPQLCQRLAFAGRERVARHFTIRQTVDNLERRLIGIAT